MNTIKKFFSQIRRIRINTDEFLKTKEGSRFRMAIFGATVAVYPIGIVLINGPLLRFTFPCRHSVTYDLPDHLQERIDEQYKRWLEHENRLPKDANVRFSCQNQPKSLDSIASGSLGVRFGVQVALPFYARFRDENEALLYCKEHLQPFKYLNRIPLHIDWESDVGRSLISTFVLSKNALDFLIARDLYGNDGYNQFANKAIVWATFTMFSSIFTYWFHTHFTQGTLKSFLVLYSGFLLISIYACYQWHYLYKHLNNCNSDNCSARISFDHSMGGNEYYQKLLQRNRIIRQLFPKGDKYLTAVGDERSAVTPYFTRYELLKDVGLEDEEVKDVMTGDVF